MVILNMVIHDGVKSAANSITFNFTSAHFQDTSVEKSEPFGFSSSAKRPATGPLKYFKATGMPAAGSHK